MRRYFVRLADGGLAEVESHNDALERVELGLATEWWRTEDEARLARLERFARWVASLDDPYGPGFETRRTVTLNQIIHQGRFALGVTEE